VPKKTPYEVLEVPKSADKEAVKRAYRKKSHKTHPDAGGDAEEFKAVNSAYRLLTDDSRRERYDATGDDGEERVVQDHEAEVIGLLAAVFSAILEAMIALDGDPGEHDLVEMAKKQLADVKRTIKDQMHKMQKRKDKLLRTIDRIETSNGTNHLRTVVEQKLNQIERDLRRAEIEVLKGEEALKLLKKFKYRKDQTMGAYGWITTQVTSATTY